MTERLEEAGACIAASPSYPGGFSGRGCVIAGGGRYAVSAYVLCSELKCCGWPYPVELWYLGPDEMDAGLLMAFETLGVTCVDACARLAASPLKCFGGWESKVFAVLNSRFEEVLFLDADSIPVVDPSLLFSSDGYRETGAVFWPDVTRFRHDASQAKWPVFGVPYRDVPEWETGQFLVDKARCWQPLHLVQYYNANSDYYYKFAHGDKDCCHLAWLKMERAFTLMPPTMQRMWGLRHFGPGGELLFQHRTLAKFRFGQAPAHPDFVNEERCLEHVDRLQAKWPGFAPWRAPGNAAHEATAGSLQGSYLYAPLKGVPRRLTLRADGGLEANGEIPWNSWRPGRDESGAPGICLRATDGWNCVARWNGKCYAGCWPMRWDPPFALLKDV